MKKKLGKLSGGRSFYKKKKRSGEEGEAEV
jgi:hypothetical protein